MQFFYAHKVQLCVGPCFFEQGCCLAPGRWSVEDVGPSSFGTETWLGKAKRTHIKEPGINERLIASSFNNSVHNEVPICQKTQPHVQSVSVALIGFCDDLQLPICFEI